MSFDGSHAAKIVSARRNARPPARPGSARRGGLDTDRRRLESALCFATTLWPRIVEEQARIALGDPEEAPELAGKDPQEAKLLLAGYNARAAQRVKMSTRAAEFIADILGARKQGAQVAMSDEKVEMFGGLPEDMDGLIAENERLDQILARAKAWQAEKKAREQSAQEGDGKGPTPPAAGVP